MYACSPGDGEPLPASTRDVKVREDVCQALFDQVAAISDELRGGEVTASQACYLPNVNSGHRGCPIVGADTKTKGLIIAAGHTCWVDIVVHVKHCFKSLTACFSRASAMPLVLPSPSANLFGTDRSVVGVSKGFPRDSSFKCRG